MITPAWVQTMARYNAWQNQSLYGAANTLDDAARRLDRGAFFRSIHETLSHLVWGDTIWMARFEGLEKPAGGITDSTSQHPDWAKLRAVRVDLDARIQAWAHGVTPDDLSGDASWYSGAVQRQITLPNQICVTHFFNHQTHHRGQVHAMLTAAGAKPGDTDLVFMPEPA
ncbi:MAG: DinB family protein [Pseudomonadota bacterium]